MLSAQRAARVAVAPSLLPLPVLACTVVIVVVSVPLERGGQRRMWQRNVFSRCSEIGPSERLFSLCWCSPSLWRLASFPSSCSSFLNVAYIVQYKTVFTLCSIYPVGWIHWRCILWIPFPPRFVSSVPPDRQEFMSGLVAAVLCVASGLCALMTSAYALVNYFPMFCPLLRSPVGYSWLFFPTLNAPWLSSPERGKE